MEQKFPTPKNSLELQKDNEQQGLSYVQKKLTEVLNENELTRSILESKSNEVNLSIVHLGLLIINKNNLLKEYIRYKKEKEGLGVVNNEEIILSFFEKIQQISEPAEIEPEPQVVDVPVIPVVPIILPEDKPQPVVIPPEPNVSILVQKQAPTPAVEVFPKPEKKDWWEVRRETEVMAVEDLDGSMNLFEKHVTRLGVAEKDASGRWIWKGGNKKLVFLGDILGDRNMNGIEITNTIFDLADQAEKQGGQVDMLCGNHDLEFVEFLGGMLTEGIVKENGRHFLVSNNPGAWEIADYDQGFKSYLTELRKYIFDNKDYYNNDKDEIHKELGDVALMYYRRVPEILNSMRNTPEGMKVLENICRIKVAIIHDDTLFCHTDPTLKIITDLLRGRNVFQRVAGINNIFQENLSKVLSYGEEVSDDFKKLISTYIDADNREYFTEQKAFEKLAESLLASLMENLYENKKIKVASNVEKDLNKNGFSRMKWENWRRLLFDHLNEINVDDEILQVSIKTWNKENGLAGNYAEELAGVLRVMEGKKTTWTDGFIEKIESLAKKIMKLNPPKNYINKIKNSGINSIIHGHTPKTNRYYDKNDFVIVSPHAYFDDSIRNENGITSIQKNGRMDLIGRSFRGNK